MSSNSTVGLGTIHCNECGRDNPVFPLAGTLLICPCGSEWVLRRVEPADAPAFLEARQVERSIERGETFAVIDVLEHRHVNGAFEKYRVPARYIMCLRWDCPAHGRPSFSKGDIEQRYCVGCHTFHRRQH